MDAAEHLPTTQKNYPTYKFSCHLLCTLGWMAGLLLWHLLDCQLDMGSQIGRGTENLLSQSQLFAGGSEFCTDTLASRNSECSDFDRITNQQQQHLAFPPLPQDWKLNDQGG